MRFTARSPRGLGCLLLCAACLTGAAVPGRPAPSLRAVTPSGTTVDLAALRGRVVIVDFWASWCEPCRAEMPFLDTLSQRFASQGLTVIGVSVDEVPEHFRQFAQSHRIGFTLVHDAQHAIAAAWAPEAMPTSFVIDRRGNVVAEHRGFVREDEARFEHEITDALARAP